MGSINGKLGQLFHLPKNTVTVRQGGTIKEYQLVMLEDIKVVKH